MNVGSVIRRGNTHRHAGRAFHFLLHLLEMIVAMMVGMMAGGAAFFAVVGMRGSEAVSRYPVAFTLVMAFSMTVPMIAWMRFRGHGSRACLEMAAATAVPAILLVCLSLGDVITGSTCGLYCVSSVVAMIAVMLYRRSEYSGSRPPDLS